MVVWWYNWDVRWLHVVFTPDFYPRWSWWFWHQFLQLDMVMLACTCLPFSCRNSRWLHVQCLTWPGDQVLRDARYHRRSGSLAMLWFSGLFKTRPGYFCLALEQNLLPAEKEFWVFRLDIMARFKLTRQIRNRIWEYITWIVIYKTWTIYSK